ncbi:hypothetical protein HCU40_02780 [Pseudanabaena biceps]|nr:hypothetical protein [Pseudanabaena biceps]
MSAPHHLPQRHLNLSGRPHRRSRNRSHGFAVQNPPSATQASVTDRLSLLIDEIEAFLQVCTYEEMCNFWDALHTLRQCLQKEAYSSEVPQFLTGRQQNRDFCRILEVLADLPYPKLHLSEKLSHASVRRIYAK